MSLVPRETPHAGRIERGYVISAAWEAIDNNIEPQGSDEIDPILKDLLQDSNALNNSEQERGPVTRLVWRLGVLRNMTDLVLKNVASLPPIPEILDYTFPEDNLKNRATAQAIITAEPNFFKKSSPFEQDALWRLVGLDPKNKPGVNFADCLDVFKDVTYLPLSIVDELRHQRDNATNMEHPPRIETVRTLTGDNHSIATYPSHDEKQLAEAEKQLLLGGFLALHTRERFDKAFFTLAMSNYTERTLEYGGVLGLQKAMECAANMHRLGFLERKRGNSAFQFLDRNINSRAAQTNIDWLTAGQTISLAEAVYSFSAVTEHPQFQEFKDSVYKQLEELQKSRFNFDGMAPETDDHVKKISLKRQCMEVLHLYRLTHQPRPQAHVAAETMQPGLDYYELNEALKIINSELDGSKKQKLRQYFNNIVHDATLSLKLETTEQQARFINDRRLVVPVLTRFDSGSRLIDKCITSSATLLKGRKSHSNKPLADNIYSAMWCNLDFYGDPASADQTIVDNLNDVISDITPNVEGSMGQKMSQLADNISQRRKLAAQMGSKPVSPLYDLLNYYKMIDSIKL